MPRTIDDIIPPSRKRSMEGAPREDYQASEPPRRPRARHRFPWGTAIVALLVIIACVGALYAFSGAKIDIVPATATGTVSGTFTASPSSGELPFVLVNVQKTASENVPAESTVTANDAAQGTVTVYNEQSRPQDLIKNTRFETSSGLIFRIHAPVTIPAATASGPGTVQAIVYAESPGETYNIGPSSFTLPGLTDPVKFKQVYAKSADAMAGGFSGSRSAVSTATDAAEHAKLQAALAAQIPDAITAQVPSGYALVPGGIFAAYAPLPDAAGEDGAVSVREQATATAIVFPFNALAKAVSGQIIGNGYEHQPMTMKSVQGLALSAPNPAQPAANAPFSFTLSGSATVIWTVDAQRVAGAVAGKSRAAAQSVLTGFPEIAKASLTLRPFWRGLFPTDPTEISVMVHAP